MRPVKLPPLPIDRLLVRARLALPRLREERGSSTLEWVVITTLIIAVAIAAAAGMKDKVTEWLAKIP
ncbi:hypothetical protein [Microbispora sp. H10949]|uniref:hypothetical protein n=1 Tax=Microbispora sp. H10949 TaxID=2729111 RepID=UPI0016019E0B|nr:hypothetical protein [Microbispora sp. H10949]